MLFRSFRMDVGPDTFIPTLNRYTSGGNPALNYEYHILGKGMNVFYNAGMLELHVKRTELNFLRLIFAVEWNQEFANRRQVILGATHVGVYHREYKPTGSFQIEFDSTSGFEMASLGDNTQSWANNLYAIFNPDPTKNLNLADIRPVGDYKLEISFGLRTDDMTGTMKRFDNSATPSFYKITAAKTE
mgnify:CR=1 FL=1